MTEQVNFVPPEEDDKPKIPGLPVPKIIKDEVFSISYNHKDHTFIIAFSRSGEIKSTQAMNRIDKSIESLSAKLAQQAISLAEMHEDMEIEIMIISPSKTFTQIIKTLSGLLLRNVPQNLNYEVERSSEGSIIRLGTLAISHYSEPVQVLANAIQRDQVFVLIDGRGAIKWSFNFKPPQSFLIVESLSDLTNPSNTEIMALIDSIKPTSYFQANSTIELINSISNVFTFVAMSSKF